MSRISSRSPLLQAVLRRASAPQTPRCAPSTASNPAAARAFSHLPTLRPTLFNTSSSSSPSSVFRAPNQTLLSRQPAPTAITTATTTSAATGETLDLIARSSITTHPALAGCASQIRCGPRPTMANASRLVQKRRHGFLSRVKTQNGRKTLARRKAKGRKKLSA